MVEKDREENNRVLEKVLNFFQNIYRKSKQLKYKSFEFFRIYWFQKAL